MKKMIAFLIAALMILGAACAMAETPVTGGWTVAGVTEVTEENRAVFDLAMEKLLGVEYEPIAYLGSQVVAGLNHCFLCRATVVSPDAVPELVLVYIYEDLSGNAEITHIADLDLAALAVPAEPAAE